MLATWQLRTWICLLDLNLKNSSFFKLFACRSCLQVRYHLARWYDAHEKVGRYLTNQDLQTFEQCCDPCLYLIILLFFFGGQISKPNPPSKNTSLITFFYQIICSTRISCAPSGKIYGGLLEASARITWCWEIAMVWPSEAACGFPNVVIILSLVCQPPNLVAHGS